MKIITILKNKQCVIAPKVKVQATKLAEVPR